MEKKDLVLPGEVVDAGFWKQYLNDISSGCSVIQQDRTVDEALGLCAADPVKTDEMERLLDTILDNILEREWPKTTFTGRPRPGLDTARQKIAKLLHAGLRGIRIMAHQAALENGREEKKETKKIPVLQEAGLHEIVEGVAAIGAADLNYRIPPRQPAEFEELCNDFNVTVETLQGTLRVVNGNTQNLVTGSGEIERAAIDLAKRCEDQAKSLEESAAAINQLSGSVQSTADTAKQVQNIVQTTEKNLLESRNVMNKTVETMQGIRESSGKIENISRTINDIAFQTNILALNASVEAARAGDVGRGFSVVATEVRALAERTADAAKEIRQLVSVAGTEIENGTKTVGESQETLETIINNVGEINKLALNVSSAVQEQSVALQQINNSVSDLDRITQRNASMSSETVDMVKKFSLATDQLSAFLCQFDGVKERPPIDPGVVDLDSALVAHAEWKAKLRRAIERHQQLDSGTIRKDNCCVLGKWIYGTAQVQYPNMPEVETCRQFHAQFHQEAANVAEVINAGRYHEAEEMLKARKPYSEASRKTCGAIMHLKEALGL